MEHQNVILYTDEQGHISLEVSLDNETVWLSQKQMAELFDKNIKTINEHIGNVFKEGELEENSTIRNFRIVQIEGKREVERDVAFYNLDVIISVGYRVKSKRGTQFRIWASKILKDYLIKGYALNHQRINAQSLNELTATMELVRKSIEEKAANLLYYVIKDHAFSDGNKRISSFLFILFLHKNGIAYKANGEPKINDNALVSLALLVASSDSSQKELMVRLIVNLLSETD